MWPSWRPAIGAGAVLGLASDARVAAAVPLEQLGPCAADVSATLGRLAPVARTMTKRMLRRAAPLFEEAAADGYLAALALLLAGGGSDQPHSGAIP